MCLFQTSIGFWRERGVYCRLHSQSTADTVPSPSLPVCFVDRRDSEAAEAAGKIAKSSGRSQNKRKRIFSRVTQWRWRSCEPPNDNRSHKPCGLHTLPVLCFVDRRDSEAAEAAGKIAKSSGDSAAVPRTKGKEFFSRVSQWQWRSCEPQNDNRSHKPCGLRRSACTTGDAGWRAACSRHQAECMFEGQGPQVRNTTWAVLACF